MTKTGKDWGPLHPGARGGEPPAERLAKTDLPRERQHELYRFLKLNRMVEERLGNLYRQGKVVGGLYSSRGQEATSVGSAYALAPQDMMGPLIRNLGSMLVRGVEPREVMMQYMARERQPDRRQGRQHPLRRLEARPGGADLDARRGDPGDGRRGARRPDAGEESGRPHLHRRRRHLDGRLPRRAEPRRGPQRPVRPDRREQRLGLLDADREADADQEHRHPRRRLRHPRRDRWTATTCSPSTR